MTSYTYNSGFFDLFTAPINLSRQTFTLKVVLYVAKMSQWVGDWLSQKRRFTLYPTNFFLGFIQLCDICSRSFSVPRSEQFSESVAQLIMSADKYLIIFPHQMEAIFRINGLDQ